MGAHGWRCGDGVTREQEIGSVGSLWRERRDAGDDEIGGRGSSIGVGGERRVVGVGGGLVVCVVDWDEQYVGLEKVQTAV